MTRRHDPQAPQQPAIPATPATSAMPATPGQRVETGSTWPAKEGSPGEACRDPGREARPPASRKSTADTVRSSTASAPMVREAAEWSIRQWVAQGVLPRTIALPVTTKRRGGECRRLLIDRADLDWLALRGKVR
jgi:hypothetical protein